MPPKIGLESVEAIKEKIFDTFAYLHSIPEPPFGEEKTGAYLAGRLREAGFEVIAGLGGTGLTGSFSRPTVPVLGFRADMDALGHEIDGKAVYIHSCGHDANMTMVLCAAELLIESCPELKGHLKVVFQPAEEIIQGAPKMAQAGAIDDISVLIGIHLRPEAETLTGIAVPHLIHSSSTSLIYSVKGQAAHTGRPHQGINAADALAAMAVALNAIKINPQKCATINVVGLKAGGLSANVVPEAGEITVNFRAEDNELAQSLREKVEHTIRSVADVFGVTVAKTGERSVPAGHHDQEAVELSRRGIEKVLGRQGVIERMVTPGAEDFSYYSLLKPGLKTTYIGLGSDLKPGLHHPSASFSPEVLITGTQILIETALEFLRDMKQHGYKR